MARSLWKKLTGTSAVLMLIGSLAQADTLADALRLAYETNPSLSASRAALRAVDENVALARAAMRPQISLSGTANFAQSPAFDSAVTDTYSAALNASLTLYDGGQSRIAIEAAKQAVLANRAGLRSIEQQIMLAAIIAYVDVQRDAAAVQLARNNLRLLEEQVQATRDRFNVGAVTRTDVSLAEARAAGAQANLAAAQGMLAASNENYRAVIGVAPSNLAPRPPLPGLPASLEAAEAAAQSNHPSILASLHGERAAVLDMQRARAARGVSVDARANIGVSTGTPGSSNSLSITGSIPLYTGGSLVALVRQAGSVLERRMAETQDTRRVVSQNTAIAWANLRVARAAIEANRLQVAAAQLAWEGTVEEARLGARTTLDVLNAEQEKLNAQNSLNAAQRNAYVAGYNLLASIGALTADQLNIGIQPYDPDVHFNQVRNAPATDLGASRTIDAIADRWR
ncbi:MAG: TolC family outer membrane protein [Paracoccaceae bacterium]